MRFRLTVVVDGEISEQQAFDKYGATDVYALAHVMQAKADEMVAEQLAEAPAITAAHVKIEPL